MRRNDLNLRLSTIGYALILVGIGAASSSLLGPLGFEVLDWRISENMENQILGGDLVILALVAPAFIMAGLLWLRGHPLAPVLAIGPSFFSVYTWPQYILAPEYQRYAGNNENFFPLYIAMTLGSWVIAVIAWSRIDRDRLPEISRGLRRGIAGPLLVLALLFALAWTRQIADVISGDLSIEYLEHPTLFWLVKTLDFAFAIPLLTATGVGLLLRHPLAIRIAFGLVGGIFLLVSSVAAMGIVMLLRDNPDATTFLPTITSIVAIALGVFTGHLYRAYLAGVSIDESHTLADEAKPRRLTPIRRRSSSEERREP